MAILAAVGTIAVASFAALVVDVGYVLLTKAQLQNVADTAAQSGNLELGRIYEELGNFDPSDYHLTTEDRARVIYSVNTFSQMNTAGGEPITILPQDIIFGAWDSASRTFVQSDTGVTAIQVMARRDSVANGPVNTLLASIMGRDSFDASAGAGAAIAPVRTLPAGSVDFPVGIARAWFEAKDSPCGNSSAVMFYPTGTTQGCAGWHTFEIAPANAETLKSILHDIHEGRDPSPEIAVGETFFEFTGGTVDSALKEAERAYHSRMDADGTWQVHLPVYDRHDCSNPQGSIRIVGVATATITGMVTTGAEKQITANVQCDVIGYGEGGGPDYGTHVGLPTLIE